VFIEDHSGTGSSYLIIFNSIFQLLDESTQDCGVVSILQEFEKSMLFRERPKLCDDPIKLPGNEMSKSAYFDTSTNLRSSTLLAFSA